MKPTLEQTKQDLAGLIPTLTLGEVEIMIMLSDASVTKIHNAIQRAYTDGYDECLNEIGKHTPYEPNEEMIGTTYAAEAFKDCADFDEFKLKLQEITNRSYNFLKPLGL